MSKIREAFARQQEDRLYPEPWPDQQVAMGVPPRSSGSGYTVQVLDGGRLRAFPSYPSRKKTNRNNGSR